MAYARSSSEIVRAVVASPRAAEIQEAVSPAAAFPAEPAEVAAGPSLPLLGRIAAWAERLDGEKVRLVACLDPEHPVNDPWVVYECFQRLMTNGLADGILGVSRERNGKQGWAPGGEWIEPVHGDAPLGERPFIYVFRRALIDDEPKDWRHGGHFLPYELSPIRK